MDADRTVAGLVGDRYEITGLIASGGMGAVYRANDTVLERTVALKVLRDGREDQAFVERFRAEATNAARLSHPGIVQVYDFGNADGTPYIAMELVEGQTLREVLAAKTVLRPEAAAQVALQVAAALEHARRGGVLHRDVKPENILLTTDGQVKVADFGLSRVPAASDATAAGTVLGTAHYLAPEQVRGDPVDHRADLYALGVVLYEMLTGRPPFGGDSPGAIACRRVHEDVPSAMATNPSVPRALDDVVLHATARDPAERYPTAGAMADALRATGLRADTGDVGLLVHHTAAVAIDDEPTIVVHRDGARTKRRRRRRGLLVALLALLALAGGSVLFAQRFASVTVPGVVGATQEEAKSRLEAAGLRVDAVLRNDATVAAGRVVSQKPPAGASARSGAVVHLVVSIGPELVSAPSVRGMAFADAEALLRAQGLAVVRVDAFDDAVPRLRVIAQSIEHGVLVERGSAITLTVSKGPELVRVPNVVGDPEAQARADIERLGFTVAIEREQNAQVPAGRVIEQTPAAGTRARKGSVVRLTVSTGPPLVRVPDLRCKTRRQAADSLAHAGLKARFEDSGTRVVDQFPGPGDGAPKGSTVTVYMGFGSFC